MGESGTSADLEPRRNKLLPVLIFLVLLFQFSLTYGSSVEGILADDIVPIYITAALLVGSITNTVRTPKFSIVFSAVGLAVVAVSYIFEPDVIKILASPIFALGVIYYAAKIRYR